MLLPLQLTQIGWSRQHIGMLFSAWGVVTLVVHPVIGLWSDRRGRQEPMIFGLLLAALFVPTLFMFLESLWMFPLVFCTIIALTAALVPTLPLMADGLEEDQAGKAFGFYNVSFSIGIVLGPWLGGYVTEQINVVGAAPFLSGSSCPDGLCFASVSCRGRQGSPGWGCQRRVLRSPKESF